MVLLGVTLVNTKVRTPIITIGFKTDQNTPRDMFRATDFTVFGYEAGDEKKEISVPRGRGVSVGSGSAWRVVRFGEPG